MDFNNNSGSNRNDWDKWNSNSSHNSYYNQPTHSPHKGRGFEYASFICGLISISFLCTGLLSLPLGALGLFFAILTRRAGKRMSQMSKTGAWLSGVGLGLGTLMIIVSLLMLPAYTQTEEYRNMRDTMYERFMGMDYEEFMQQYYGTSPEESSGQ